MDTPPRNATRLSLIAHLESVIEELGIMSAELDEAEFEDIPDHRKLRTELEITIKQSIALMDDLYSS